MSKFPHERESTEGRSVLGDFMDDDLNEKIYDTLIEASQKIQAVLDILRDHNDEQSSFEMGCLSTAQTAIENNIDPDYPPLKALRDTRINERLLWAVQRTKKQ